MPKLKHRDPRLCPFRDGRRAVVYLPDPGSSRPRRVIIPHPFASPQARTAYYTILADWHKNGRRAGAVHVAPPSAGPVTVAELCARVWQSVSGKWKKDGKPKAKLERLGYAIQRLRAFDDEPADNLGLDHLQAIADALAAEGKSKDTLKKRLSSVKDLVSLGASLNLVSVDVVSRIETAIGIVTPPEGIKDSKDVDEVADRIVNQTLPYLPPNARDLIAVLRLSGARSGEITSLLAGEVQRTTRRNRPVSFVEREKEHKTAHMGHKMIRYFNAEAQAILDPYLKKRTPDEHVFSRSEDEQWRSQQRLRTTRISCGNRPGYSAATRAGKPPRAMQAHYTPGSLYRAVERACKAAGVKPWHPHQLRHAAAAEFGDRFGEVTAMQVLGQRSVTVFKKYRFKQKSSHEKAMAAVAGVATTIEPFRPVRVAP